MRCYCCNRNLSDYESTLRHPVTGDFLDTCKKCLQDIPVQPIESGCPENSSYSDEEDEAIFDDETLETWEHLSNEDN